MHRLHARGPVEPPFGCATIRLVSDDFEPPVRRPRYVADGRYVVVTATGRAITPPVARREADAIPERAISRRDASLRDVDIEELGDLIRAIWIAERADPTPPAAVARAA